MNFSFYRSSPAFAFRCFALILLAGTTGLHAADFPVSSGSDFQAALYASAPGDTITLQAGQKFIGSFTLPAKSGDGQITIQSSDSSLNTADWSRVSPDDASRMPAIIGPAYSTVLTFAAGANNYRLTGLEIRPEHGDYSLDLIYMDGTQSDVTLLPHNIEIDHCYIHGDVNAGGKGGIAANGVDVNIHDNYMSDLKSTWQDTNGITVWNSTGPFQIWNNYIEATGVNIIFGGAAPAIDGAIPTHISIHHNHLTKNVNLFGGGFDIKDLLEFKMAKSVWVGYNLFDNCRNDWGSATAIVITPRTEYGAAPWVKDLYLLLEKNFVMNCDRFLAIAGTDSQDGTHIQRTFGVWVKNNAVTDIHQQSITLTDSPQGVWIDHNLLEQEGDIIGLGAGDLSPAYATGFVLSNNIIAFTYWGIQGNGVASGTSALDTYVPGWVASGNVFFGTNHYNTSAQYPGGNNLYSNDGTATASYANAASSVSINIPGLDSITSTDGNPIGPNF